MISIPIIILLILAGLVIVAGLWLMTSYNGLVTLRQSVKNAWAQIDVQLKRRHDLIPNLVNTVKGYAAHEKETFERVIQRARARDLRDLCRGIHQSGRRVEFGSDTSACSFRSVS